MILEEIIKEVLIEGGFYDPFVDYFDVNQPAPKSQLIYFDELADKVIGERFIFIREGGGGGGNKFVNRSAATIVFAGLQEKSDAPIVKDFSDRLYTYLLETNKKCGIIDINPIVGASPVMFTDAGRPIVEISCTTLVDRGIR